MKNLILIFCLFTSTKLFADLKIKVQFKGSDKLKEYSVLKNTSKENYLELGDTIVSLELNRKGKFRIYQKIETSVSVMDEGPHLDLTKWKHGVTKWKILSKDGVKFKYWDGPKKIPFANYTLNEFLEEVDKRGGDRWKKIAEKCINVEEYPCGVGHSLYKLKVEEFVDGEWIYQGELKLLPALGC